ncbi:ABC-type Fe3+-siderophore transport system, permease component [Streptococcus sp. DD10]|uniref:FecCD family ABC transporter permease n=1 Tax=Streptococcus sp. DD10 TaxID=1777878 RepID=UPI00079859F2|nr:iron ABC transporter permease [Streptococcus sp. DD10]KXT77179.1 ABC-type Fe3+-siderophore transport system, permease component [Streptococcus sp. DD10]
MKNRSPLHQKRKKDKSSLFWLVFITLLCLLIGIYVGLRYGAISYQHTELINTLLNPLTDSKIQDVIMDIRLPRLLAALLVGAAMACSGLIMQGITRNPIADPGLLGINTGAGMALALASAFIKGLHYTLILMVCLLGSLVASILVFTLSYQPKKGYNQLRLVLAGAMISTLFSAIGQGVTLYFKLSGAIIGWQAGGLVGTNWTMLAYIAPLILIGLVLSFLFSHQLSILSLHETVAKSLGQRTLTMTMFLLGLVVLLSASSVALVGSLAFIGLIIPHFVKLFLSNDYRLLLPVTALVGGTFMLWADFISRIIHAPYETPLNAIIAIFGLPCFIFLIRGRREL